MPHIFERFYRGGNINEATVRGTGIGLSIVKELVDLLDGAIWVESDPDGKSGEKGSTFYVKTKLNR
ncbi:MAG: sensor histidine kinase [Prolixibacteraceae bacterium]|nr:sensor histidine kinase [Prolixibacteraceae bacterium]